MRPLNPNRRKKNIKLNNSSSIRASASTAEDELTKVELRAQSLSGHANRLQDQFTVKQNDAANQSKRLRKYLSRVTDLHSGCHKTRVLIDKTITVLGRGSEEEKRREERRTAMKSDNANDGGAEKTHGLERIH